jgi:hypothetical protein
MNDDTNCTTEFRSVAHDDERVHGVNERHKWNLHEFKPTTHA